MQAAIASKRLATFCTAMGICMFGMVASAAFAQVAIKPGSSAAIVSRIADRWVPVASQLRTDAKVWRAQFSAILSLASPLTLSEIDAMTAKTDNDGTMLDKYQRVLKMATVDAGARLASGSKGSLRKLGSATNDLVFTPIAPCRVVDTRVIGGPLVSGGGLRNFNFYADAASYDFAAQGGTAGAAGTVCPSTVFTTDAPRAAVATVTATGTTDAGNFVVWGGGPLNQIPNTSALNWDSAGDVQANTTVIEWGGRTGGNQDFAVIYNGPSGSSQIVVDVVGYFSENLATALNCVTEQQSTSVPIGATVSNVSATCGAGFTATGGGCAATGVLGVAVVLASNPTSNGWNCTFLQGLIGYTGTAYANCCQVPGR